MHNSVKTCLAILCILTCLRHNVDCTNLNPGFAHVIPGAGCGVSKPFRHVGGLSPDELLDPGCLMVKDDEDNRDYLNSLPRTCVMTLHEKLCSDKLQFIIHPP